MLAVEKIEEGQFRSMPDLCDELHCLAQPSYVDSAEFLRTHLAHCDTLYLRRDTTGSLVCFLLVAYERLELAPDRQTPAVFVGPSVTRDDTAQSGLIMALYARCLCDAIAFQRAAADPGIMWCTTATPSVYLAASAFSDGVNPLPDGSYSPELASYAQSLKKLHGAACGAAHPFVLPKFSNTRYSPQERKRILRLTESRDFRLFSTLGVNELEGDRLLLVSRIPERIPKRFERFLC